MKYIPLSLLFIATLFCACNKEEATQYERTSALFVDSLGGNISTGHWWRTSVTLNINVTTDEPVRMWLLSVQENITYLFDYNSLASSGSITMTAPQGQGDTFTLAYEYKKKVFTKSITLSGKPEEQVNINTAQSTKASIRRASPPPSLCGYSKNGDATYYQFSAAQMEDYFEMMNLSNNNRDAKQQGLNTNYELKSHGPFYITWVNGYEADQRSRILGYYTHSPYTYEGMEYHDLSETHKWDYIDGLSKVQYQIDITDSVDGHAFFPNTWYDANFDMHDSYGSIKANNKDRLGDKAYNSQLVYNRYGTHISALRGISFLIDVE